MSEKKEEKVQTVYSMKVLLPDSKPIVMWKGIIDFLWTSTNEFEALADAHRAKVWRTKEWKDTRALHTKGVPKSFILAVMTKFTPSIDRTGSFIRLARRFLNGLLCQKQCYIFVASTSNKPSLLWFTKYETEMNSIRLPLYKTKVTNTRDLDLPFALIGSECVMVGPASLLTRLEESEESRMKVCGEYVGPPYHLKANKRL